MAEVRVAGAEPWRFADRCIRAGIWLADVREEDPFALRATLRARELSRAETLAAGCGCTLELLSRRGFPEALRTVRRRRRLWAGAALAVLLLFASSLFVWDIRVTENDSPIPDGDILRVLAAQGVGIGSFTPSFRTDLIRSRALAELPELCWLAVNVRGSRASVEVRAAVPPPEIWDPRQSGEIRARRSGVITELRVLEGQALCARGDAVTEGQCLISSTTPDGRAVHARGEVRARTWYEITASASLTETQKTDVGGAKRFFSLLLGKKRGFFFRDSGILPENCDKITRIWRPGEGFGLPLPLAVVEETLRPYAIEELPADPARLRAALEEELTGELRSRLGPEGEILSRRFTAAESEGRLLVTLRSECAERIDLDTAGEGAPG